MPNPGQRCPDQGRSGARGRKVKLGLADEASPPEAVFVIAASWSRLNHARLTARAVVVARRKNARELRVGHDSVCCSALTGPAHASDPGPRAPGAWPNGHCMLAAWPKVYPDTARRRSGSNFPFVL